MDYAKAIRICRAAFGLKQSELARCLKIGPSHLSLIESGKRQPSLETIEEIAHALHIPKHLLMLLASEPEDLTTTSEEDLNLVSRSLLNMLVEASDRQQILPFGKSVSQ